MGGEKKMIQKMQINMDIHTEIDSPDQVKDFIYALLGEAGDRMFAIDSVTMDGIEVFKISKSFQNDLAKK